MTLLFSSSSYYEGWDNPFRPEGELSLEAEELLRLWKQGRLTKEGGIETEESVADGTTDLKKSQANGNNNNNNGGGGNTSSNGKAVVEVKRTNLPQIVNPKHVKLGQDSTDRSVDDDPAGGGGKKKNKGCCSVM